MLDKYLQQLVEEGELDSQGVITLDPVKARKKLAESGFASFSEALLALIVAAISAGAQQIKISSSRAGWLIHCEMPTALDMDLTYLLRDMFGSQQAQFLQELALVLISLYPKVFPMLRFISGSQCGYFKAGEWTIQHLETETPGWTLHLTHAALSWQWWKWLTRLWQGTVELNTLKAKTCWSPVPILFEHKGQCLSSYQLNPPRLNKNTLATVYIKSQVIELDLPDYSNGSEYFCHHRVTRSRTSLRCALVPGDPNFSQIYLVYRGITIARHQCSGNIIRFEGVINTDSLDLDASHQKIVQNKRLRHRADAVRRWVLEATVQWLKQLDPQELSSVQKQFLPQLLSKLNRSETHRPVLEALQPMPVVILGDNTTATLQQVQENLIRYPNLHVGYVAELHERLVVHPEKNGKIDRLAYLLEVKVLDVSPWVKIATAPEPGNDITFIFSFKIKEKDWQAWIHLPYNFEEDNQLLIWRKGKLFSNSRTVIFENYKITTSLAIYLEGDFDYPLNQAEHLLQTQLREAFLKKLPDFLQEMRSEARKNVEAKSHLAHYCSLLSLWLQNNSGEQLEPEWLDYPFAERNEMDLSYKPKSTLAQLLEQPEELGKLLPGHPARQLAQRL